MNKRYWTSLMAWIAGALAVRIGVAGYIPIGIGVYTAIVGSSLIKFPAIIIMGISIFTCWGFMDSVKYVMVMAASWIITGIGRSRKSRETELVSALTGAILYGAMELLDSYMSREPVSYGIMALVVLLTFSSSIAISRVIDTVLLSGRYTGNKKKSREEQAEKLYEEKIRRIASSFEKMSKSINAMKRKNSYGVQAEGGNMAVNCIACGDIDNIESYGNIAMINNLWRGRITESRDAIALQLEEMSKILKECMTSSYTFVNVGADRERYMELKLKNMGMSVRKTVMLNNRRGINEINITVKAMRGKYVTVKELENAVSDCFGKRYKMTGDGEKIIRGEYKTYNLLETPNYFVLHGTARCGKDGNMISGDNFTCMELQSGQTLISVSDGMGHGLGAYKESEMVLSLLEEMMDGGFTEEASLRLINSVFMVDSEDINPASVDMGILDMYSGVCDFLKIGASTTFIKRGGWIESIRANSMPIGSEPRVDMEVVSKKMYDGDFIIMVSDGVVDAIDREDRESCISNMLMDIESKNPQEMARQIMDRVLEETGGVKNDDMLVMVAGIWDKCA